MTPEMLKGERVNEGETTGIFGVFSPAILQSVDEEGGGGGVSQTKAKQAAVLHVSSASQQLHSNQ